MTNLSEDKILLTVFVSVEGVHAFSAFMPSAFTIEHFASERGDLKRLRDGYLPAVIFNVVLAGSVSALIDHPAPLVINLITVGFMIGFYESLMRKVSVLE